MRSSSLCSLFLVTAPLASGLKLPSFFLRSEVAKSPLHIELHHSDVPGFVKAVTTNRGPTTAYFSRCRNPLSADDHSRRLDVFSASHSHPVDFLTPQGLVVSEDIPDDYERLLPGASISRDIRIVFAYDLIPNEKYHIRSDGAIPYYLEGESPKVKRSANFETNSLTVTAPEAAHEMTPRAVLVPRFTFGQCKDKTMADKLAISIPIAAQMAKKAAETTRAGGNKEAFAAYFKTDNAATRKTVADRYAAIATALSSNTGPVHINCRDTCTGFYARGAAWTTPTTGLTEICPVLSGSSYPADPKQCIRMSLPGVLIHELSHSSLVFRPSTNDRAQGSAACKRLSASQAIVNADTFNMYAQSVWHNTVC